MVRVCLILPSTLSLMSYFIYILADLTTLASKISTKANGSDIVKEEDAANVVDSHRTKYIYDGSLKTSMFGF